MKKWVLAILLVLTACLIPAITANAATQSSDTMILEWTPQKVWVDKGELIMQGYFYNQRSGVRITKVNRFVAKITFTRPDGSKYQYIGEPKSIPFIKLGPYGSKKVTFNFGKFDDTWKEWVADEDFIFTYID